MKAFRRNSWNHEGIFEIMKEFWIFELFQEISISNSNLVDFRDLFQTFEIKSPPSDLNSWQSLWFAADSTDILLPVRSSIIIYIYTYTEKWKNSHFDEGEVAGWVQQTVNNGTESIEKTTIFLYFHGKSISLSISIKKFSFLRRPIFGRILKKVRVFLFFSSF